MITPMTKLTMLIYHRDYNKFLTDLRDHGVVHVHAKKQTLQDENMKAKMAEVKHINNVVKLLEKPTSQQVNKSTSEVASQQLGDLKNEALIDHIDQQYAKIDSIQQEIASLQKDSNVYAQWGKFPEERLNQIKANNWDVRFFTVPSRKYDNVWEEEFNAFLVNELAGFKYFTTITPKGKDVNLDAESFHFPAMTKSEIENKIDELKKELTDINQYLTDIADDAITLLKEYKQSVLEDADFYKVSEAAEHLADDKIMALEGWVPTEIEADTISWLKKEDIYFEATAPEKGVDNPPIKLKNRKFARLFEMIGNMYSIPTYWELDMTPFFAPFFVLFFGFCMGDCGFGALLVIV